MRFGYERRICAHARWFETRAHSANLKMASRSLTIHQCSVVFFSCDRIARQLYVRPRIPRESLLPCHKLIRNHRRSPWWLAAAIWRNPASWYVQNSERCHVQCGGSHWPPELAARTESIRETELRRRDFSGGSRSAWDEGTTQPK